MRAHPRPASARLKALAGALALAVLLGVAPRAHGELIEDRDQNYSFEIPSQWIRATHTAAWNKLDIVAGATRELAKLEGGKPAKGQGAQVHLAITDVPEGKDLDALTEDEEVLAFLMSRFGDKGEWHMVGHLQTNKVRDALGIFKMIHSLDSLRLGEEIEKRATTKVACLIEVNTSKEPTKFGVAPSEVFDLYEGIAKLRNIDVQGLMTIGPGWATEDPEASRPCFRVLRGLQEELAQKFDRPFPVLSMGMTSDYEVAIEEGSTLIRIGTAIFGTRDPHAR